MIVRVTSRTEKGEAMETAEGNWPEAICWRVLHILVCSALLETNFSSEERRLASSFISLQSFSRSFSICVHCASVIGPDGMCICGGGALAVEGPAVTVVLWRHL